MIRTFDKELIKACVTHPRVWPWIRDDGSPSMEAYEPVMEEPFHYLAPGDGGVFLYHPLNCITWEIHCCLTPKWWGKSVEASRESMKWMIENTGCRKIVAHIPENNTLTIRLAEKVGMTPEGISRKSFLKDGVLLDQHSFGITEAKICHF